PAALRARAAQRGAAEDHRRVDRALGREGDRGRDQGRRDPRADAAGDRPPGRGRARAAGEDHQLRGRVPGGAEAHRRGRHHQHQPGLAATALPADAARNRQQPEHHGGLPAADGRARAVRQGDETHRVSAPELRIDQLSGLPVVLAPGRAERPEGLRRKASEAKGPDPCPFCEGREERTPPEVYATRPGGGAADTVGWTTRVVPNLYPALDDGGGPDDTDAGDPTAATKGDAGAFATAGPTARVAP